MSDLIKIKNVSKRFKETTVLDNISLEIEKGKICGLVGRNGAGKTMLMKCICGFVIPDEGEIEIFGKSIGKGNDKVDDLGIIIENPGFLPQYDGYKNLKFLADINHKIGEKEIKSAITYVGLDPNSRKPVGKYSLGMKQRLAIAQAIMENQEILILDEPMNGLDNQGVEHIRKMLIELRNDGKTIILASHSREDIDILCDKVVEMDHGKIVKEN